jgi:DNA-binding XRE family transcriptional regulator
MSHSVIVPPGLLGELTDSDCIIWQGAKSPNGYGYKSINGKVVSVHRAALEAKLGRPIKQDYCACHTCDHRLCINPEHLWEGTQAENLQDAAQKGRLVLETRFKLGNLPANHKLTAEKVDEIRQRLVAGEKKVHLAHEYGVSRALIYKIEHHILWEQDCIGKETSQSKTPFKPGHVSTKQKLSVEQVEQIRNRLAAGEKKVDLAHEYGVSRRSIYNIEQRIVWK